MRRMRQPFAGVNGSHGTEETGKSSRHDSDRGEMQKLRRAKPLSIVLGRRRRFRSKSVRF